MPFKLLVRTVALLSVAFSTHAAAGWQFNMPRGVTDISQEVFNLHMLVFWVCVAIGVVVFGIMFYSMYKHRKSKGAESAQFHESTKVEILWTLIPTLIILAIGVRAFFTLEKMYDFSDSDMTVEIVGYQWKWRYTYLSDSPDAQVSFFSNLATPRDQIDNLQAKSTNYLLEVDEPLVLPVGTKVRFVLSAADVIHSWWVPALAVKKDAIPGIVNEAWTVINEPGIYRGQCTELCGKDHGFMPIEVHAVTQEEFDAWYSDKQEQAILLAELTQKDWTFDELMDVGKSAYERSCAACHGVNGEGVATFPALRGSAIAMGDAIDHIDIVVNGSRNNPAMAAFGPQLSEVDIAAIITYERNAWGNNVGDMVTPLDILNFKQGL